MTIGEFSCSSTRISSDSKNDNTISEMNVDGDGQDKFDGMNKSNGKKNSSTSSRRTHRERENISGALVFFIDVYAESTKKRNEIVEHKVVSSSSNNSSINDNSAVRLVGNDGDEELLNQYFEILNTIDEIDEDTYSKDLAA